MKRPLRDWLSVNDAAHFGAQLPELLRGVYYEHWRPANRREKHRSRTDFLARVADAFEKDPIIYVSEAVMAVFDLLSHKLSAGEIEKVRHALPADLRSLWPVPSQAA